MKKLITLLVSTLIISSSVVAQIAEPPPPLAPGQKHPKGEEIFTYVEQMPEPGFDLGKYLSENIVYPKDAMQLRKSGRVVVKFIITETGAVDSVRITKPVFPSIDSTAKSVVEKMPHWKPGKSKGKPVKVYFTVPIKFNL
jgi:protein TonB